jgi:hypothetical protein
MLKIGWEKIPENSITRGFSHQDLTHQATWGLAYWYYWRVKYILLYGDCAAMKRGADFVQHLVPALCA